MQIFIEALLAPEVWGTAIFFVIIGFVYFKLKYKNAAFHYGFDQGKRFIKNHGKELWEDVRDKSYRLRLKIFSDEIFGLAASEKIKFIDAQVEALQEQKGQLEQKKDKLEKDLQHFDKDFSEHCSRFSKETWKQILDSYGENLEKLFLDIREFENLKIPKSKMKPLLNNLEEELKIRFEKLDDQIYEIDNKIKSLEKEILPLQKQNLEIRNRKTEPVASFASLRLKDSWNSLVNSVVEVQESILKYFLFIVVMGLLLVDFVVPFQYFREYWSDRIGDEIFSLFGSSFTYHNLSVVVAVVIILAILTFLELLFEDFWAKERRAKYTINRITFYLFSIFNVTCAFAAFYFWYQFRQNYVDIDKMLIALTIPVATAAALILKKLRKGTGFHFLFAPLKTLWFLIELPCIILIDILLFFRRFQFAFSTAFEVRRRNKIIRDYQKEIKLLDLQKEDLNYEFHAFKIKQEAKMKLIKNLKVQIGNLEGMLERRLDDFSKNIEEFKKLLVKEIRRVGDQWQKERQQERVNLLSRIKVIPCKTGKIKRKIDRLERVKKSIHEGIERAVQEYWGEVKTN